MNVNEDEDTRDLNNSNNSIDSAIREQSESLEDFALLASNMNRTIANSEKYTKPNDHISEEMLRTDCEFASAQRHHQAAQSTNTPEMCCHECDFKASTQETLLKHVGATHLKTAVYVCDLCEYESYSRGHVAQHTKIVHMKVRDFACDECDYKAPTRVVLNNHVNSVHLRLKNVHCPDCDYKTATKCSLGAHIKVGTAEICNIVCRIIT
jgi:hypothetical protein